MQTIQPSDVNLRQADLQLCPLKIKPNVSLCKRFVLHTPMWLPLTTLCHTNTCTHFVHLLSYTLRSVPHTCSLFRFGRIFILHCRDGQVDGTKIHKMQGLGAFRL